MPHVTKFVECLPWERWAVNSLIIMIYYNVEGIELFQKLYKWLEHMVPKDMRNSSKINKAVREFCKFSQRVKLWIKVFIINKIVNIQGFRENPKTHKMFFWNVSLCDFFTSHSHNNLNYIQWTKTLKYVSKLTTEWLDISAVHCNKLSDIILHRTIYSINDRKIRYCHHISVQLQVH